MPSRFWQGQDVEDAPRAAAWLNDLEAQAYGGSQPLPAPSGSDDAAAITAAIAAGGAFVAKSGGAYKVGAPITYTGSADLVLDFTGATVTLNNGVNDRLLYVTGTGRVKIRGGVIDGNKTNNTGVSNTGLVEVQGPSYLDVDGVKVKNAAKDGIRVASLTGGSIRAIIDTTGDSGIAVVDSNDVTVSGDVNNAGGSGILIGPYTQDCQRIAVRDATVRTCATVNTGGIGVYFNSGDVFIVRQSSIVGVRVYNAGYVGIFPGGDDITVDGCVVDGSGVVTAASAHAFWSHDSTRHTYVGCIARNSVRAGFAVGKAHEITYNGCISERNQQHGFWFPYDNGVTGRYTQNGTNKDIVCVGCFANENGQALANTYSGFYIDGMSRVTITGCQAHDYQGTQTQKRGITMPTPTNGTPTGCKFINNDFASNLDATQVSVNSLTYLDACYGNKPVDTTLLPADLAAPVTSLLKPTAATAENFPRVLADGDLAGVLVSGTLRLCLVYLRAGTVVNSITAVSGATALATGSNQWFGLWNLTRTTLLGVTSDDTSTAWAANTTKTLTLASPYTIPADGFYYIGICVVATTTPTLRGHTSSTATTGLVPVVSGNSTTTGTGLTNPASAPANPTLGSSGSVPYVYVS